MLEHGVNKVSVPAGPVPPGFSRMAVLGMELTEPVLRGLAADGIVAPTPVQQAAFEAVVRGRHSVIQSGTGTGKTLAYVLPLLQRLLQRPSERVVCVVPSSELAIQTLRTIERYKPPDLQACALLSLNNPKQRAKLQQSTRFIVGTLGCIVEMYAKRKLKNVTMMVLDEPEPILAGRDAPLLREILSRPEPAVQLVLVAATFGVSAERFIRERMGADVFRTQVGDDPLRSLIKHVFVRVRDESSKDRKLVRFIEEQRCQRAVVFVNQPNLLRHLYRFLNERGIKTVTVSHERSQAECKQALVDFKAARAHVLLTTDRTSTGIDLPGVDWVLHYELPLSPEAYVHRAGRTGRAGRSGSSVVFVSDANRAQLERMADQLEIGFEPVEQRGDG